MFDNVTCQVTLGTSKRETDWSQRVAFQDILSKFQQSPIGDKDGPCFTPATFRGIRRANDAAEEIAIVALDSDHGHTLDEIKAAIVTASLEALIHSTHSHLAPDPRYRIIIPLTTPWRACDYADQNAANQAWSYFIRTLATSLGLATDQSCSDTARLFFFPRSREGGPPFEFQYVPGGQCDMAAVLAAAPDPRASAGPHAAGGGFSNVKLKVWVLQYGDTFEIIEALRAKQPGVLRRTRGIKTHIECPFEHEHGKPGGEGCFAVNASGIPSRELPQIKSGFVIRCKHDHCVGRDRLHYVEGMLAKEWLTWEDLEAPEFHTTQASGAPPIVGATREDFWAFCPMHTFIYVLTGEPWPASTINELLPKVKVRGSKPINASADLIKHRAVQQMVWIPGAPQIIEDKQAQGGSWIPQAGARCFNLYKPPQPITSDPARAGRWINLVKRIYPEDADHIITYFAHRVQHPGEKINHALFLGGLPGIGKDSIIVPLIRAVGDINFDEAAPQDFFNPFNKFKRCVVLRVSETHDLGEVDRFKLYERMKTVITAPPDVTRINEKNLREYYVANVCSVIITSNYRTDGLYLPSNDRRHYIAWSEITQEDFPTDFWVDLYYWYKHDGIEDITAYLAELDISHFDPKKPPFKTPAFWAIANTNLAPEIPPLLDAIDDLGNPAAFTLAQLETQAPLELKEWLTSGKNAARAINHRLETCDYIRVLNPNEGKGQWRIAGKRQAVYVNRKLSLEKQLEAARTLCAAKDKKP